MTNQERSNSERATLARRADWMHDTIIELEKIVTNDGERSELERMRKFERALREFSARELADEDLQEISSFPTIDASFERFVTSMWARRLGVRE